MEKELELFNNKEQIKEVAITYLKNANTQLTQSQLDEFVLLCMEYKLNPLKKEIYAVSFKGKFNVITNYYEYLKRADATRLLEYYNIEIESDDKGIPIKGWFVGKRKDQTKPLKMEFWFKEWTTGQSTWLTKPHFMFDKCIVANGMRRLFPNELGNMPYVNEELWYWNKQNEEIINEHISNEVKND